ncbi:MAG TPA: hypothetical protein VGP05_08100, partial [Pseudonocardia sp.]|nr:hypothetical protein [Pseudonocardia sp.]
MANRPTSGAAPARAGRVTGSRSPLAGGLGLAIGAVLLSAAMTPVDAPSQPGFVSAAPQTVVPAAMLAALPVSALPVSALPVSALPVSALPVSALPVSALP